MFHVETIFAVEGGVSIGYMQITVADATTIQDKFDEICSGIATVTSNNGTITIKLLEDITGCIDIKTSNSNYILDANGHTFSGGEENEAILINHDCSGVTLELVGNGTYDSGRNYAFFVSSQRWNTSHHSDRV